jgi:hypothetical protein
LAKAENGLQGAKEEASRLRSGFQLKEKMFIVPTYSSIIPL